MYFYVSVDNSKITRKEMSKLFPYDYDDRDMVKCRRNMDLKETNTEPSKGENGGF